jgi:hypothetical protein
MLNCPNFSNMFNGMLKFHPRSPKNEVRQRYKVPDPSTIHRCVREASLESSGTGLLESLILVGRADGGGFRVDFNAPVREQSVITKPQV